MMIRKFNVTVNGNTYAVEVEEVKDGVSPSVPIAQTQPAPKPAPATKAVATPLPGATNVTAPMPGAILNVHVKEGDSVKKGQALLILEAMKMENEILAPTDGTVAAVYVRGGSSVNTSDLLVSIK